MGRTEKFKTDRRNRKKMILSALLAVVLLITGISAADRSVGSLMWSQTHSGVFFIRTLQNGFVQIKLFDGCFSIDTSYIRRDFEAFKTAVRKILE